MTTGTTPAALGPYRRAIVAGGFVFRSGTAGIDPQTGQVAEGIEAQTEQALRNISAILAAAGSSLSKPAGGVLGTDRSGCQTAGHPDGTSAHRSE